MSEIHEASCDPTEKTLYKEPHDDSIGTWEDRLYVRGPMPRQGIGIAVGGSVYIMPMKEWHKLPTKLAAIERELAEYKIRTDVLSGQLTETRATNDALKQQLKDIPEQCNRLNEENNALRAENEKAQAQEAELLAELDAIEFKWNMDRQKLSVAVEGLKEILETPNTFNGLGSSNKDFLAKAALDKIGEGK